MLYADANVAIIVLVRTGQENYLLDRDPGCVTVFFLLAC
jgi:hypothetical protein